MSQTSGLEPPAQTVASSADQNVNYRKRDADADKNGASSYHADLEDVEKGSPLSHPPHVVKDGGLTAWGTALGAYVN